MKLQSLLLLGIGLALSPSLVWGQVATPAIDPARPAKMGAASSWRFGPSVAVGSQYGGQQTNQQKVEGHGFGSTGSLVLQTSRVTVELASMSSDNQAVWDATSDLLYPSLQSDSSGFVAVRGEGRVSVGLGGISRSQESRGINRKQSGFGGSFGVRMGEGFFGAVGMNRITEKVANFEDKQWNEVLGGLGLVYGDPDSSMFRLEGSLATSPQVVGGTGLENVHHKTWEQNADLEVLWNRWYLSVGSTTTKSVSALANEGDQNLTRVRYGLGYRKLSFSLIFYRTLADEQSGDKMYKERAYGATLGFGFL